MPSYLWHNTETDEYVEVRNSIAERDTPPAAEGKWERVLQMPGITRKTYVDGMRSKTDKGYAKMKQAAALEVERASSTDPQARREMDKAITTLTKV